MRRERSIAQRFGRAAASYDAHSFAQREAAQRLAALIEGIALPPHPHVLEIGCGTGHLTQLLVRRLANADFLATDIAPAMVAACRASLPQLRYAAMDGERPAVQGGFDLVCANLAVQWFADLPAALAGLAGLLAPGGLLAVSALGNDTFREWRAAHAALGLAPGALRFPAPAALHAAFPAGGKLHLDEEYFCDRPATALDFLRRLRALGADAPALDHRPLTAAELRRVLRQFDAAPAITYHLLYARFRKAAA